jgi:hypothetical protein
MQGSFKLEIGGRHSSSPFTTCRLYSMCSERENSIQEPFQFINRWMVSFPPFAIHLFLSQITNKERAENSNNGCFANNLSELKNMSIYHRGRMWKIIYEQNICSKPGKLYQSTHH